MCRFWGSWHEKVWEPLQKPTVNLYILKVWKFLVIWAVLVLNLTLSYFILFHSVTAKLLHTCIHKHKRCGVHPWMMRVLRWQMKHPVESLKLCPCVKLHSFKGLFWREEEKKVEINYNSRSTYSLFLALLAGSHRPHQWNEFPQLPLKYIYMFEHCMMFFHADLEVELDNSFLTWETKTNSICWWRWDEVKSKSTLNQYYFAICYFQGQE